MTDLVERLLDTSKFETWEDLTGLIVEAADEIERLREAIRFITTDPCYRALGSVTHDLVLSLGIPILDLQKQGQAE